MKNERVKPFFECPHCFKKLTTQARLDTHNCEKKKRHDYMQTPKGKSAYFAYKTWLNGQGRSAPDQDAFMESRYFGSFKDFVSFCNTVGLPDRKHFVQYMVEKEINPQSWSDPEVYADYLNYFDKSKTPLQMSEYTMTTIFDLADMFECEPGEVFEHMYTSDILKLVHARKLSPWVLLFSKGFKQHVRTDTTPEQRILISTVIDPVVWGERIKGDRVSANFMQKLVKEFNI